MSLVDPVAWRICTGDAQLSRWLGPPPEASLRLDAATCTACPAGHVSNTTTGVCEPCPAGLVVEGNACIPCPPGKLNVGATCEECIPGSSLSASGDRCICGPRQVPTTTNNCSDCASHEVVIAGVCTACNLGSTAVFTENRCACAPHTIQATDGVLCEACPAGSIAVGGVCEACPVGFVPLPGEDRCVPRSCEAPLYCLRLAGEGCRCVKSCEVFCKEPGGILGRECVDPPIPGTCNGSPF